MVIDSSSYSNDASVDAITFSLHKENETYVEITYLLVIFYLML